MSWVLEPTTHRMTVLSIGAFEFVFGAEEARNWLKLLSLWYYGLQLMWSHCSSEAKVCAMVATQHLKQQGTTACGKAETNEAGEHPPYSWMVPSPVPGFKAVWLQFDIPLAKAQTGSALSFLDLATQTDRVYLVALACHSGRMIF